MRYSPDKGEFLGHCNRSICLAPDADWYNRSTQKYYCWDCAKKINEAGADFHLGDGKGPVCTEGKYKGSTG